MYITRSWPRKRASLLLGAEFSRLSDLADGDFARENACREGYSEL